MCVVLCALQRFVTNDVDAAPSMRPVVSTYAASTYLPTSNTQDSLMIGASNAPLLQQRRATLQADMFLTVNDLPPPLPDMRPIASTIEVKSGKKPR